MFPPDTIATIFPFTRPESNEEAAHAAGSVRLDGTPALVVSGARGECDALRRISGAYRPDPLPDGSARQLANHVLRSANLERADRLKRRELEKDFRIRGRRAGGRRPVKPNHRRPNHGIVNRACRILDGTQGNLTHAEAGRSVMVPFLVSFFEPPTLPAQLRVSEFEPGRLASPALTSQG